MTETRQETTPVGSVDKGLMNELDSKQEYVLKWLQGYYSHNIQIKPQYTRGIKRQEIF